MFIHSNRRSNESNDALALRPRTSGWATNHDEPTFERLLFIPLYNCLRMGQLCPDCWNLAVRSLLRRRRVDNAGVEPETRKPDKR